MEPLDAAAGPAALALADLGQFSLVAPGAALRRPLAELVAATLAAAGRSANTRRAYQTAIGLFLQFLDALRGPLLPPELALQWRPFAAVHQVADQDARGRPTQRAVWEFRGPAAILRLVDPAAADGFRAWREAEGDGANAASSRVYAVRTFLRVALRDGVLSLEQANALGLKPYVQRQKRDVQPVGRRLSPPEVRSLRAAPDPATTKGKRDLAILDTMLFAGLRRDEAAGLALTSLRRDGGRWWLVLAGKGQKTRRVKVHDTLYKSLAAWLVAAGRQIGGEGVLFSGVRKDGRVTPEPLNAGVIGRLVAEYGHLAKLAPLAGPSRLSAHDLRRTCARNAFDHGASLLQVQAMLGHSDPKTTARYIGALEEDDDTAVDHVRY